MSTEPSATKARLRKKRGPAYDYRDHPEQRDWNSPCDHCPHRARWSIAQPEGWDTVCGDFNWIIRAMACGQHLHSVLDALEWDLDAVQLYDLAQFPEGC